MLRRKRMFKEMTEEQLRAAYGTAQMMIEQGTAEKQAIRQELITRQQEAKEGAEEGE
jgi:hypothetical protein